MSVLLQCTKKMMSKLESIQIFATAEIDRCLLERNTGTSILLSLQYLQGWPSHDNIANCIDYVSNHPATDRASMEQKT